MQRQKYCSSHPQTSKKLMPSISKSISLQKKKRKILERICLLTPLLLTYLVINTSNRFLTIKAKLAKKTRIAKKVVFGAIRDKNRVIAMTPLQQVLTPISSRKKRRISLKSNFSTAIRRDITIMSTFKTQKGSQKTNIVLDNFHVGDCK